MKRITTLARPIGIDLFAGAGGLSLGFEAAGFDVAAAVEIDPLHCATHEFNFPYCRTICASALDVSGVEIRRMAGIEGEEIAVVFGGTPCQGFSMIGKRSLDDPRNELTHRFLDLVLDLRPAYFVFENVSGLTVGRQRRILDDMISVFDLNGYHVLSPHRLLNASDYCVPQNRRRLFLMGAKEELPLPKYPESCGKLVTVAAALDDLPDPYEYPKLKACDWTRAEFGEPSEYARELRGDAVGFGYRRIFDESLLTSSLRTTHAAKTRRRFAKTPIGKTEPVSRFRKLDPAGLCNTIRAGTGSDRGAFTSPRPIHPRAPRCITNREAARLHSYPDWFRFHVTKWHGFRQIGNSVPPLLARAVASEIMSALGISPVVPEKPLELGDPALLSLTATQAALRYGIPVNSVPKRCRGRDIG